MPKRASVPEGKALFFRPPDAPADPDAPPTEPVADAAPEPEPEPAPARPPAPSKTPTRQSAIFLEERHIDWLEDRCREARRNGGRAIRKAAVIRAILDVAMEADVHITALRHEDDLLPRIRQALRP